MNVKKKCLKIEKIFVDIVLCPKTKLYLQSLYCHKCAYFKLDEEKYIICKFEKPQIINTDKKNEKLIKIFSKVNGKNEISSHQLVDKGYDDSLENRERLKADIYREMEKRKKSALKI